MHAYKFLADGAVAPFTGRSWPAPDARSPGAWMVAPPGDLARYGVHACRIEDLAYWPDDELWLVELGGTVLEEPFQLAASRGRLVRRIDAWNAATAREYAAACAFRARDLAADALSRAGLPLQGAALAACIDLATLEATAATLAGSAPRTEPRGPAAYVAGAAMRARQGRFREAALQHAHLGAALEGSDRGAANERAWQSAWLARGLELEASAAGLEAEGPRSST
ncbi:MAG TPA: hypothetical protein VFP65_12465 [Anaeromyxobacteraceae bacterium]|nr:hypothetical protein [Anaeromyxobacteraceae bacterium]